MQTKQHVQRPKLFNQAELDQLIQSAQEQYKKSPLALHCLMAPILQEFLTKLEALQQQGYKLSYEPFPPRGGIGQVTAYLTKPEEMQQQELDKVAADVKAKYEAGIEEFNAEQKALLAQQLYNQEVKKQEEAERKRDEKLRNQAAEEAEQYFQSIITKSQEEK